MNNFEKIDSGPKYNVSSQRHGLLTGKEKLPVLKCCCLKQTDQRNQDYVITVSCHGIGGKYCIK